MVDLLAVALRAKRDNRARTPNLVVAVTVSTTVVGFVAYYVAAVLTGLVPNEVSADAGVLVFGMVSGAVAGFAAARLWNRYLARRF